MTPATSGGGFGERDRHVGRTADVEVTNLAAGKAVRIGMVDPNGHLPSEFETRRPSGDEGAVGVGSERRVRRRARRTPVDDRDARVRNRRPVVVADRDVRSVSRGQSAREVVRFCRLELFDRE
ncbi:hypothetical protein [Haladaptatus sp. NG-WS-4]